MLTHFSNPATMTARDVAGNVIARITITAPQKTTEQLAIAAPAAVIDAIEFSSPQAKC